MESSRPRHSRREAGALRGVRRTRPAYAGILLAAVHYIWCAVYCKITLICCTKRALGFHALHVLYIGILSQLTLAGIGVKSVRLAVPPPPQKACALEERPSARGPPRRRQCCLPTAEQPAASDSREDVAQRPTPPLSRSRPAGVAAPPGSRCGAAAEVDKTATLWHSPIVLDADCKPATSLGDRLHQ